MTTAEPVPEAASTYEVRELRLALVCYGGVSLAIYMHGITKEIERLVAASASFERDPDADPFPLDDTASVYLRLLRGLHGGEVGHRSGVVLRVVVDVISGTSAGGINGICLAKALVQGRTQESLRQVWLEKGDIGVLVGGRQAPWILHKPVLAVRALARVARRRSPLRGDEMCRWIQEALDAIDVGPPAIPGTKARPLVPADHRLELFVPVTDFTGLDRRVPLSDPRFVWDRTHRQVMVFRHDEGDERGPHQFGPAWNRALGFAARATSSFPGAFPPISPAAYDEAVGGTGLEEQVEGLFPYHRLAGGDRPEQLTPYRSPFVDGGVLDNFPFGSAIEAIRRRRAASEVDRRLLFLEPDPSLAHATGGTTEGGTSAPNDRGPGLFATVWGGYAGIPRKEPILGDLVELARHNVLVQRLRGVIEANFRRVSRWVGERVKADGQLPPGEAAGDLAELRARVAKKAATEAGFAYLTYLRLRASDAVDRYAAVIAEINQYPDDSNHAWFVRDVLRCWARERGFLEPTASRRKLEAFLDGLDIDYSRRRLRFLLAALSWWYRPEDEGPSRAELDLAKQVLHEKLLALDVLGASLLDDADIKARLDEVFSAAAVGAALERDAEEVAGDVADALDELAARTRAFLASQLRTWEREADDAFAPCVSTWSPRVLADLRARDLGFALWDVITYPVESLGGGGERDQVEAVRVSPRDVTLLAEAGVERPLAGADLAHFGAFFTRKGRECDYLSGRLDGAERLIRILLDDPDEPGLDPLDDAGRGACMEAFRAVVDGEAPTLTEASELIGKVRRVLGPSERSGTDGGER